VLRFSGKLRPSEFCGETSLSSPNLPSVCGGVQESSPSLECDLIHCMGTLPSWGEATWGPQAVEDPGKFGVGEGLVWEGALSLSWEIW
jgi:hypothetical protein